MLHGWKLWFLVLGTLLAGCQGANGAWARPGVMAEADDSANAGSDLFVARSPDDFVGRSPNGFAWMSDFDDTTDSEATKGGPREPAAAAPERLLIQRGSMRLEVVRPDDSAREFLAEIKTLGGYLQTQTGTSMTVRLPAASFDEVFLLLRGKGRVLDEKREANDVTEEFVDLGIRIDTARKARERLLEALQKAEKVEDILKVEAELRRLTEEIERMEGRKKFLADQVAMATLAVAFVAKVEAAPPPPPKRSRVRSQFDWINRVGPESLLEDR